MSQEDKMIQLSALTDDQANLAIIAIEAIKKRAEEFTFGLKNSEELIVIIEKGFQTLEKIVTSRLLDTDAPTNNDAIKDFFEICDYLEGSFRKESARHISYDALYDFLKAGRIIAFKDGKEIIKETYASLRDMAMSQADIPREI